MKDSLSTRALNHPLAILVVLGWLAVGWSGSTAQAGSPPPTDETGGSPVPSAPT